MEEVSSSAHYWCNLTLYKWPIMRKPLQLSLMFCVSWGAAANSFFRPAPAASVDMQMMSWIRIRFTVFRLTQIFSCINPSQNIRSKKCSGCQKLVHNASWYMKALPAGIREQKNAVIYCFIWPHLPSIGHPHIKWQSFPLWFHEIKNNFWYI